MRLNIRKISADVESVIMAKKEAVKTKKKKESVYFSTGCDLLDLVFGGGLGLGIPGGRIINILGDKSAGKTFLACEIIAAARYIYKERLRWEFDDSESGFTFDTEHLYGFAIMPPEEEDRTHSETVEDLYCNVRKFLDSLGPDELGIYVVDSLDGLTSEEGDERADKRYNKFKKGEKLEEGSYQTGKAKYLSQEFFPQLADYIKDKNALLIVISQIRDNFGNQFVTTTRAGGRAMNFYCHTVLSLNTVIPIKKRDRAIGVVVRAKATKSKTPRPFRETLFTLFFDYGLDNIGSDLDFLYDLRGESGKLLAVAKNILWEGEEPKKDNLKEFLVDNKVSPKTMKTLKNKQDYQKYIAEHPELKEKYEEQFGATMTKDELVLYIEEKGLQDKLKEKVVSKWEEIEESIRIKRPRKYTN